MRRRAEFQREAVSKRFGESFFLACRRVIFSRGRGSGRSGIDETEVSRIERGEPVSALARREP
jgi:hypothetical protein